MRYVVAVLVLAACGSRETPVVLAHPTGTRAPIALTAEDLEASLDRQDDRDAVFSLITSGRVWTVQNGTVAVELARDGKKVRVRCENRIGWTWDVCVRR